MTEHDENNEFEAAKFEAQRERERFATDAQEVIDAMRTEGLLREGERYNVTNTEHGVTCEACIFMGPFIPGQSKGDPFADRMIAKGYTVAVDPGLPTDLTADFFASTYKFIK